MTEYWWIAAFLVLVGVRLGGLLSSLITNMLSERRAERVLVSEARIALKRSDLLADQMEEFRSVLVGTEKSAWKGKPQQAVNGALDVQV